MTRKNLRAAAFIVLAVLALAPGCSRPAEQAVPPATSPATTAQPGTQAPPAAVAAPATPAAAAEAAPSAAPGTTPVGAPADTPSARHAAPPAPAAALAPAAPPTPPRTFTLEPGTALRVRTASALSTKTLKPGDSFTATLVSPITDGDWAIAAEGAKVTGVVVDADEGGRVKGVASLSVALQRLELSNGNTIDISTSSYGVEAKSEAKKDAATIGIGAAAGAGVGAIVGGKKGAAIGAAVGGGGAAGIKMATRGAPAVIGAGRTITFKLKEAVTVTK